ncbi:MAG: cache domain-containing protein [Lachnospiraceae bacterium]|nr:cache domain-containing protein [Lachnospiraceae bacterium]
MKMKAKILTMVIIPLVLLATVTIIVGDIRITEVVTANIENGLRGAAVSVRDTLVYMSDDAYRVDDAGNLYKGEFNLTEHEEIADNVKQATDMDITVFYGDTRYMTSVINESGDRVLHTQAGEKVIQEVLVNGNEYFAKNVDVVGQKYFGYYVPLYDNGSDEIIGMIFAGMPQKDANNQIFRIVTTLVLVVVGMAILCVVLLVIEINNLVSAIHKGSAALEEVADGKLNAELDERIVQRKDEIGQISRAIAKLKQQQTAIIQVLKEQSHALNTASEYLGEKTTETANTVSQVEKAVEEVAEGATNQAEETQTATDNVIFMGEMVEETAREVQEMHENARTMQELGQEAFETLHELNEINEQARESIQVIYEQTNMTNESVQKIKEATGLITAIAAETNLLSLNASIEAARAGEQGRGFAVVAAQIQQLAEQSNESAKQIETIISYLNADSEKAVKTMDVVKDIMDKQTVNVEKTDERFQKVISGIADSLEAINRIAEKTENLDKARVNVIDTVQSLTAIAEENAASTEETFASITEISSIIADISAEADELKQIANEIDQSIDVFEL